MSKSNSVEEKRKKKSETTGIPEEVLQKLENTKRKEDGTISVGGNSIRELSDEIDWQDLTPFQEFVLASLKELSLLDELVREIYDGDGENPFNEEE
jgi:S-adenosylmethionine:tRNA-ribosyltransferase-isomerase (queuine synthetase)